jgi:hypothetical protein
MAGRPLPDWALDAVPAGEDPIKVIDVNAGPVTALGNCASGREVELVAVDSLAHEFDKLLSQSGHEPPVKTQVCAPEDILVRFGKESFHLIYSCNGLDFTGDPIPVYRQLLECLAPGGRIITFHELAQDERRPITEGFRHFHRLEKGRVVIQRGRFRRDLQDALPQGTIRAREENGFVRVEIARSGSYGGEIVLPQPLEATSTPPVMVSMHLPKTGGSSFRAFLEEHYGRSLRCLYAPEEIDPERIPGLEIDPGTRCLHGHFQADAFDERFPEAIKITWMRDPVERIISNYFQYLRHPNEDDYEFNRRLISEGWSLMRFARDEGMREAMRWFFNAVPLESFFFVGIVEEYEASMKLLAHLMRLNPSGWEEKANVNPSKVPASRYVLTKAQRDELSALYAEEIEVYQLARYRLQEQLRMAFGDQAPELADR